MTTIEYLEEIKAGYLAALAADAANPRPDYSLDGQTVSRSQWRQTLLAQIKTIQELVQTEAPYELRGFAM